MKKYFWPITIFLLGIITILTRFYHLSDLPAVLHRDESSIAFNAYSLLKTGKDEHQQQWPLSFQAFGDYKLPGLIYLTIPFIKFFGLNSFTARLPNAVFGCLLVVVSYFFCQELFKKSKLSLLFAFFIASTPFFIIASRNSYEPAIAIFLDLLALVFFLKGRKHLNYLLLFIVMSFLSSYFYHSALLLLPFIVAGLFLLYRQDYLQQRQSGLKLTLFALFYGLSLIVNVISIQSVNASRSNTTIFNSPQIADEIQLAIRQMYLSGVPLPLAHLIFNKLTIPSWHLVQNYLATFDPNFLFFRGDHNPWHSLENIHFGNVFFVILFFLLAALYGVLKKIPQLSKEEIFLLFYLLLSPLPCAITIDAPINNRLFHFHFALLLFAAYGVYQIYQQKEIWLKWLGSIAQVAYGGVFIYFLINYAFLFNKNLSPEWYEGVPQLSQQIQAVQGQYQRIYVGGLPLAYSFFSVYQQFDPADFQQQAVWKKDGFDSVQRYQKYIFESFPGEEKLNLTNIEQFFTPEVTQILVVQPANNQDLVTYAHQLAFIVSNYENKPLWMAYHVTKEDMIGAVLGRANGPERTQLLKYLQSL